jgi:hypothetical protein
MDNPMVTQVTYNQPLLSTPAFNIVENSASQLKQEYDSIKALFNLQPAMTQRFLETQAGLIAHAITEQQAQVHFALPDRVVQDLDSRNEAITRPILEKNRQQAIGGLVERLARNDIRQLLRQRLLELELSPEPGVSIAARLIRYATADYMLNRLLPSGRNVTYLAQDGEDIPWIPLDDGKNGASAITAKSDAIVEKDQTNGREELQVPYVPAARRFFLPQWVAFDEQNNLLVNSIREAQTHIASMQRYLEILHATVSLAPYMMADVTYQQKRYGMLGQLVNQGRTLAAYETNQIVQKIRSRASSHELDRGLSLSLPYFDDQALQVCMHNFDVIPAGRVMFVPAFVVRAARQEQVKVAQDTRLSPSTRKYLLAELETLENAFI